MKKIDLSTSYRKLLADIFTPVGIYLRLRDRFRDTILLESTDFHAAENSYSFIGINAIAGIEIKNKHELEYKYPGDLPQKKAITHSSIVSDEVWNFMGRFNVAVAEEKPIKMAQGLFGYTTYDAVQFFETINLEDNLKSEKGVDGEIGNNAIIPLVRYRLYQYVIAINHFKDELYICENHLKGIESEIDVVESLIKSKDVPTYPFRVSKKETSAITDEDYIAMVKKGITSCERGDVFQVVLSRRFRQEFTGDEFNVYRALRNINP
ncbi:MAG: anthranilate synthase component I family protein, partial [Ginsengibacter sp.]